MRKTITLSSMLATCAMLFFASCNRNGEARMENQGTGAAIQADPRDIAANITLDRYGSIVKYFNDPKTKIKMQFASEESRFAWQNASIFYPTAQVLRMGKIWEFPYSVQDPIGSMTYRNNKGETFTVDEHFRKFPIDGMIVIKHGNIVYERYKTLRPDDKHVWYSISKVIGPTLMLFLEEEGKVDVNLPVTHYLQELKGTAWDSVKVVEALDMATGLNGTELDEPGNDAMVNPDRIWYKWAVSIGMIPKRSEADTAKWYEVLGTMKRIRPPYDAFAYNSINTFVVDRIVERAGGKSLAVQLCERIWGKMGMEHDGYLVVSPTGFCLGNGFMSSTLRDLARFGMIYTPSQLKVHGEKLISDKMLAKMQDTTHNRMYTNGSVGQFYRTVFPDQRMIANRYQWDAVFEDGDLFKSGLGGQGLYVSPSKDMVVAWFSTGPGDTQEEAMARAIVQKLK